jgi:LemA protein
MTPTRVAALLAALLLPLFLSACGINDIPTKEEAAKAKWGDVQSQYQRRADLVPNLVETVKGYAAQERTVLNEVTSARARATSINISGVPTAAQLQQYQAAQAGLSGALGRLLAVAEAYPDLKSNQNFLALQSQLEGTENRIQVARQDYNEAVRAYNTSLRTIPSSWWKFMYPESKPMALFTANAAAQTAPTVDFGAPNPGAPMGSAPAAAAPGAAPPEPAPAR